MKRWAVLLLLLATPAMAHEAQKTGRFTLIVYTERWAISYGNYPTEELCKTAMARFTSWTGPGAQCFQRD